MERRITRRQALGAAGSAGAALLVSRGALNALGRARGGRPGRRGDDAGTVAVTPTMTEGPYWIDEMLRRFDVRNNTATASASAGAVQAGVPLALKINVLDAASGGAINGAHVDIWHANAYGLYSDEGGQPGGSSTSGQNFLRGYQVTGVDAGALAAPVDGQVNFKTIWPGWYSGPRDPHPRTRPHLRRQLGRDELHDPDLLLRRRQRHACSPAPPRTTPARRRPTRRPTRPTTSSPPRRTRRISSRSPARIAEGFAATFTIGLTGVASNAAADTQALTASIVSAKVTKASNGNRTVAVSVKTNRSSTAHASLLRDGKTLAKAAGQLTAGNHTLRMALGKSVDGGCGDREARARRERRHRDAHEEGERSGLGPPSTLVGHVRHPLRPARQRSRRPAEAGQARRGVGLARDARDPPRAARGGRQPRRRPELRRAGARAGARRGGAEGPHAGPARREDRPRGAHRSPRRRHHRARARPALGDPARGPAGLR